MRKAETLMFPKPSLNYSYTLADQLFVEPQPLLHPIGVDGRAYTIEMSEQERAIALSHVRVWEKIARSDHEYVLILEDDVYFTTQFAPTFEEVWANLLHDTAKGGTLDLLYLSFEEAKGGAEIEVFVGIPNEDLFGDCGIFQDTCYPRRERKSSLGCFQYAAQWIYG